MLKKSRNLLKAIYASCFELWRLSLSGNMDFCHVCGKTESLAKLHCLKKKIKKIPIHTYSIVKQNFTAPFPKHCICTEHVLARSQQIFMNHGSSTSKNCKLHQNDCSSWATSLCICAQAARESGQRRWGCRLSYLNSVKIKDIFGARLLDRD